MVMNLYFKSDILTIFMLNCYKIVSCYIKGFKIHF